jgi:hypothetical protein
VTLRFGRRLDGLALGAEEVVPTDRERFDVSTDFLDIHADLAADAQSEQPTIIRMREVEMKRWRRGALPREAWLARRGDTEAQRLRCQITVATQQIAHHGVCNRVPDTVALEHETVGAVTLLL